MASIEDNIQALPAKFGAIARQVEDNDPDAAESWVAETTRRGGDPQAPDRCGDPLHGDGHERGEAPPGYGDEKAMG